MKKEAESVSNLKEVSYQLENKVIQLSESLAGKIKENKELNIRISELQESLSSNVNLQEALKLENENSKKSIDELNSEHSEAVKSYEEKLQIAKANMEAVLVEVEEIKAAKEELKKEIKEKLEELNKTRDELSSTNTLNTDLQNEVTSLKSEIKDYNLHWLLEPLCQLLPTSQAVPLTLLQAVAEVSLLLRSSTNCNLHQSTRDTLKFLIKVY